LWYHEDSAGREERSVPENLERPDGDMVEMSSHSQTLIERSSTSQLRSFTSTIEQAARPEDRLRSNLAKSCSEISTVSIPSNRDDNGGSFVLTRLQAQDPWETPYLDLSEEASHLSREFATESQSSVSLQSHYARAAADATAPTRSILELRMCRRV
jgi:hypothetical protein